MMILETIKQLLTIAVALSGGTLLIFGIIYEDVLVAFEDGLKEHIKKKVRKWSRRIRALLNVR